MAEKESSSKFTAKEVEYMAAAMQCLEDGVPPHSKLDKAKFSALTGLTESSSKNTWNTLRRKLEAQSQANAEGKSALSKLSSPAAYGEEVKKTKPAGAGKKRKTPNATKTKTESGDSTDDEVDVIENSSSKKPRTKHAKRKAPAKVNNGDNSGVTDTPAPKKSRTRKPTTKKSAPEAEEVIDGEHEESAQVGVTTMIEETAIKGEVDEIGNDANDTV